MYYETIETEYEVCGDGESSGGTGGNAVVDNEIYVNVINNLTGKAKCVYDKLFEDGNQLFRETVGAFIDDPQYNLTFNVGSCNTSSAAACTDDIDPFNIQITFQETGVNSIEWAQMILHESIHAEMARFVSQYQSGVDVNNRPYLFKLYAHYKGWADAIDSDFNWDNAADHQYMITNYVDRIAETLREFDDFRYPLDNYKSYAWDGLRDNYNYTGTLTSAQETYYNNLRAQTNIGIQNCNE